MKGIIISGIVALIVGLVLELVVYVNVNTGVPVSFNQDDSWATSSWDDVVSEIVVSDIVISEI